MRHLPADTGERAICGSRLRRWHRRWERECRLCWVLAVLYEE